MLILGCVRRCCKTSIRVPVLTRFYNLYPQHVHKWMLRTPSPSHQPG